MHMLFLALGLLAGVAQAEPPALEELELQAEYPVEGMAGGNLSGLAQCGEALWAVSDRDDAALYRLQEEDGLLRAEGEPFVAPEPPESALPWGLRMRNWVAGQVRGGKLDFEGLSCDTQGNRYLISETRAAVLQVNSAGGAQWLNLPDGLVRQARASGMLLHFNQGFEGIAVDPNGERLWLAAERRRRGLTVLHGSGGSWRCTGGCVLVSESGEEPSPMALGGHPAPRDFAGLAYFEEKLFTLERQAHRICRRTLSNGEPELCWSFAGEALAEQRRYAPDYGMAEALWIDKDGAWIGVDNGGLTRADGEQRPLVWHFAVPTGGWSRRP
ncbi:esterase-like activity of phytase family protein [Pseudomonas sp. SP16.1]|uniref:esterase-like activity of phytase family protein n=1 Tax=Pseudomonas sp. SP16.1 TaxID=3458854 RepID=UPI00404642CB